ncbi:MAG: ABC transporter substrate-binding protein [Candidatus Hodarchaeales archaeon]|jgi:ABC-type Fe3+ transport system substrate-binding protein
MNRKIKTLLAIIVAISFVYSLVFTPSVVLARHADTSTSPNAITLNIITRHSSTIYKAYKNAFLATPEAQALGVEKVIFWDYDSPLWPTYARTGTYDLVWGGGPTSFDVLMREELLPALNDPDILAEVDDIPNTIAGAPLKRYNNTNDLVWVGAAISSFGFTINRDVLSNYGYSEADYPNDWLDLASPDFWKADTPLISIGNAPDTTSNTRIYEIILQKFGWEEGWSIITAIGANSKIKFGSTDVLSAVINAEVGIAITIDFYGYDAQLQNDKCEYIIPENQSIINADPIALLPGDPANREAANAFVEYVLSVEGQKIWMEEAISRVPCRPDVFDTTEGQARPDLKLAYENAQDNQGIDFNDTLSVLESTTLIYYFEATITDAISELKGAWNRLNTAYKNGNITETEFLDYRSQIGAPLITEQQAIEWNVNMYDDTTFQSTKQSEWKDGAADKYNNIKNELPEPPATLTTNGGDIPGFEFLTVVISFPFLVAIPVLRKRKNNK